MGPLTLHKHRYTPTHPSPLRSVFPTCLLCTCSQQIKTKVILKVKQLPLPCIMHCNKSFISRKTSEWSCISANKSPAMFLEAEMRNICREWSKPTEMDKTGTPLVWIRVPLISGQSHLLADDFKLGRYYLTQPCPTEIRVLNSLFPGV